jgi:hypothetical protein
VGSVGVEDDVGDHPCGDGGEHVAAVNFAPFVAARRGPEVMFVVVDMPSAFPVLMGYLATAVPVGVVAAVMVLAVMVSHRWGRWVPLIVSLLGGG